MKPHKLIGTLLIVVGVLGIVWNVGLEGIAQIPIIGLLTNGKTDAIGIGIGIAEIVGGLYLFQGGKFK